MSKDYLVAPEQLQTENFLIRSYLPGDGRLLAQAVTSSYEHLKPWMPWASSDQSVEKSEQIVREFRGRYLLATEFTLGIFSPDGQRLLGATGFHLRDGPLGNCSAEIGMWICASEAGKGVGTQALKSLLNWGFSQWPWQRLSWRCDEQNLASASIAKKAGLELEGVLRNRKNEVGEGRHNTACFAATRDTWRLR